MIIFADEISKYQNYTEMKKSELIQYLEAGGSFTVDAGDMPYPEVLSLVCAVKKGRGRLTLTGTRRLFHSEILTLCETAPGQVIFPDKKLEN